MCPDFKVQAFENTESGPGGTNHTEEGWLFHTI